MSMREDAREDARSGLRQHRAEHSPPRGLWIGKAEAFPSPFIIDTPRSKHHIIAVLAALPCPGSEFESSWENLRGAVPGFVCGCS